MLPDARKFARKYFIFRGIYALIGAGLRTFRDISYSTSLKANRNAAVRTLWVTLGPMPADVSVTAIAGTGDYYTVPL